jgi:hypothetical protein
MRLEAMPRSDLSPRATSRWLGHAQPNDGSWDPDGSIFLPPHDAEVFSAELLAAGACCRGRSPERARRGGRFRRSARVTWTPWFGFRWRRARSMTRSVLHPSRLVGNARFGDPLPMTSVNQPRRGEGCSSARTAAAFSGRQRDRARRDACLAELEP